MRLRLSFFPPRLARSAGPEFHFRPKHLLYTKLFCYHLLGTMQGVPSSPMGKMKMRTRKKAAAKLVLTSRCPSSRHPMATRYGARGYHKERKQRTLRRKKLENQDLRKEKSPRNRPSRKLVICAEGQTYFGGRGHWMKVVKHVHFLSRLVVLRPSERWAL
jgi:hypothetical protein